MHSWRSLVENGSSPCQGRKQCQSNQQQQLRHRSQQKLSSKKQLQKLQVQSVLRHLPRQRAQYMYSSRCSMYCQRSCSCTSTRWSPASSKQVQPPPCPASQGTTQLQLLHCGRGLWQCLGRLVPEPQLPRSWRPGSEPCWPAWHQTQACSPWRLTSPSSLQTRWQPASSRCPSCTCCLGWYTACCSTHTCSWSTTSTSCCLPSSPAWWPRP
mmetsp:Transcript_40187/g.89170  ORF Transcript_40187/g.89170 Transcript_40187/m.89170 type:complete len:211 (+) Transcript_40187:494-1126(+)